MKRTITTEEDVKYMVEKFYDQAATDAEIGHFFEGIDWESHLPRMIAFWSFILIGKEGYKGGVLEKHAHLPLTKPDFDRWLSIFLKTIEENFEGETALLAKQRANTMAWTFKSKFPD